MLLQGNTNGTVTLEQAENTIGLDPLDQPQTRGEDNASINLGKAAEAALATINGPEKDATKKSSGSGRSASSGSSSPVGDTVPSAAPAADAASNTQNNKKDNDLKVLPEKQDGEDLYEAIGKLCKFHEMDATQMNNGRLTKIDCFFVHKYFIDDANALHFKYSTEVQSISITNSVTFFGTRGSVVLNDKAGLLSPILENQSSFYFVIAIMDILNSTLNGSITNETGLMYQPWIFEVEKTEVISNNDGPDKLVMVELLDIISATLKKTSYGNLLLHYPTFLSANHFGELYFSLIDYAGNVIQTAHDKKYYIPKNVYYIEDITDEINPIIKETVLSDRLVDMTCLKLMDIIYNNAVREIIPPEDFKGDKPGNVLVPILLHDEFDDPMGMYRGHFNRNKDFNMLNTSDFNGIFTNKKYSIKTIYIKRGLFAKGIGMPFELAFNKDKCMLYECFNPKLNADGTLHEDETNYTYINGWCESTFSDVVQTAPDNSLSGLLWKNIALLNDTPRGAANFLIFFNWIFEMYKEMFLNGGRSALATTLRKEITPNVTPHFLSMEKAQKQSGNAQDFAKLNAVTVRLKSTDIIKEGMFHVGRTLKSYIFLNSFAAFNTKLNMIRRVGEIIKVNTPSGDKSLENLMPSIGGFDALENGFSLLYTTQITHIFQNTEAKDVICASKICQITDKVNTSNSTGIGKKIDNAIDNLFK